MNRRPLQRQRPLCEPSPRSVLSLPGAASSGEKVAEGRMRGRLRRGMSLLEVFVALAIFIAALAVIVQIISTGRRASTTAQFQSEATLRAESTMAEAIAGIIPMQNDKKQFDDDLNWQWSLTVETGPHADTLLLSVTTEHTDPGGRLNGVAHLKRIIRDPQLFLNAASSTTNSSALDLLNEASNSSAP